MALYPLTDTDDLMLKQADHALRGPGTGDGRLEHFRMWLHMNQVVRQGDSAAMPPLDQAQLAILEQAVLGVIRLPDAAVTGLLQWLRRACMLTPH